MHNLNLLFEDYFTIIADLNYLNKCIYKIKFLHINSRLFVRKSCVNKVCTIIRRSEDLKYFKITIDMESNGNMENRI